MCLCSIRLIIIKTRVAKNILEIWNPIMFMPMKNLFVKSA